jgi:rfaE bifunctional protein kinase chain/domain
LNQEAYVETIRKKFPLDEIPRLLEKFKDLKVLVIGDTVLDEYIFVQPKGRAVKDPILSVEYVSEEIYGGGAIAVANHLSDFVSKVTLVTLLGEKNTKIGFIRKVLRDNVTIRPFVKRGAPTIVKQRIIDSYRNNKLFKIEYMDDRPIDEKLTRSINAYLERELPKYDLVVVLDFGHGFLNSQIRRVIEKNARFLALNVQSNGANMGYHYFTQYQRFDFITLTETELRLPFCMRFEPLEKVIDEMRRRSKAPRVIVTQGNKGVFYFVGGKCHAAPILTKSVKDSVGAGDALFAFTSLLVCCDKRDELVPFLANCAGGIAVNIMGNKEPVTKEKLLQFLTEVYVRGVADSAVERMQGTR